MKPILCLLLLAIPAHAADPVFDVAHYAYYGSVGIDLGYTWAKLETGHYREANGFMGSSKARHVVLTVGTAALTEVGMHQLRKEGHTRLAKVLLFAVTGLRIGVIVHNLRLK